MAVYSGATFKRSPNCSIGRQSQPVRAVVLHITAGPVGNEYNSAISWFLNPASQVSAHFVISPRGDITQCVDTINTAWANGLSYAGGHWSNARGKIVNPSWQLLQPPISPNLQTVSIEMAGQSGKPIPAAQWGALYALLRWLGAVYPQVLPYTPGRTLIGHFHLDNIDRPYCPGAAFDFAAIAARANGGDGVGLYEFRGIPIYERADLRGPIAGYLPSDSTFEIDATQGPNYASNAGHLASGAGFIALDAPGVERKV